MLLNELGTRPNVHVTLVRTASGVHDHLLSTDGIEVRNIRLRSNFDPMVIPRVARLLRETKSQILISWLQASDVPSYFIRMLSRDTKWIMTERNSFYRNEWRFRLRNWVGRRADAIISNSSAGDAYWAALQPNGNRYVIGNVVTAPGTSRNSHVRFSGTRLVVFAGRLEAQKNVGVTLEAFITASARDPNLRFRIIGEGSERGSLERRTRIAGLGETIEFTGFVPDLQPHLAEADLLVTLSTYEGMPNVLVEAITTGVPVVVSGISQHLEIVGADYPYVVDVGADAQTAADAIISAAYDAGAPDTLADARAALLARTPTRVADEYLDAFRHTIRSSQSPLLD